MVNLFVPSIVLVSLIISEGVGLHQRAHSNSGGYVGRARREVEDAQLNTGGSAGTTGEVGTPTDATDLEDDGENQTEKEEKSNDIRNEKKPNKAVDNTNATNLNQIFLPHFSNNSDELIQNPNPRLHEIPAIILFHLQEFKQSIKDYLETKEKLKNTSDSDQLTVKEEHSSNETLIDEKSKLLSSADRTLKEYFPESSFVLYPLKDDAMVETTTGVENVDHTESDRSMSPNLTSLIEAFGVELPHSFENSDEGKLPGEGDVGQPVDIHSKDSLVLPAEKSTEDDESVAKHSGTEDSVEGDLLMPDDETSKELSLPTEGSKLDKSTQTDSEVPSSESSSTDVLAISDDAIAELDTEHGHGEGDSSAEIPSDDDEVKQKSDDSLATDL